MKAPKNLIPNSNKTDKALMLDEAIEYLKQLQLQVQAFEAYFEAHRRVEQGVEQRINELKDQMQNELKDQMQPEMQEQVSQHLQWMAQRVDEIVQTCITALVSGLLVPPLLVAEPPRETIVHRNDQSQG